MTSRSYCFTINNPENSLNIPENHPLIRYCVWQKEIGEKGTPHYQGYIELFKPSRMHAVKEINDLFLKAHLEKRRGTREEARAYAMKKETRADGPWEYGTWSGGSGTRTDIQSLKRKVDSANNILEVWEEFPSETLKYGKMIEKIISLKQTSRDWITEVIVCIGRPGCGKSYYCNSQGKDIYWKQQSLWWDGYRGNEHVLLDDFYGWITTSELLRICDRYPLMVQTKGGQTQFLAKKIFITSNQWPELWYKAWVQKLLPFEAFQRRVTKWVYWDSDKEVQEFTDFEEFKQCAINDGYDLEKKFLQ